MLFWWRGGGALSKYQRPNITSNVDKAPREYFDKARRSNNKYFEIARNYSGTGLEGLSVSECTPSCPDLSCLIMKLKPHETDRMWLVTGL